MNTVGKGGMLMTKSGDYYSWRDRDIHPYKSIGDWIAFKLNVFFLSLFSFFFLSTTTALLVRVLISSGVVLLFPFFALLQYCGVHVVNSRIISLSYPWIGVPMELLRSRNQSVTPFIIAHITRVVIFYSFYEACQLSFGIWFYDQARPGQRELWLFAIMMTWEYYSMIYVRSAGSIVLFPRASMALYLLYHFYLYSQPFGFHLLALLIMFLFLVSLMIHCVRKFELEAYFRGVVNIDQPRAIYNSLPWPSWNVALAPDFSVFLPLTSRSVSVYQNAVPAVGGAGLGDNEQAAPAPGGSGVGAAGGGTFDMSTIVARLASFGSRALATSSLLSPFSSSRINSYRERGSGRSGREEDNAEVELGDSVSGREEGNVSGRGLNGDVGGDDGDRQEAPGASSSSLVGNIRATLGQSSNTGGYERVRSDTSQNR
jgi:hypothetical protein